MPYVRGYYRTPRENPEWDLLGKIRAVFLRHEDIEAARLHDVEVIPHITLSDGVLALPELLRKERVDHLLYRSSTQALPRLRVNHFKDCQHHL